MAGPVTRAATRRSRTAPAAAPIANRGAPLRRPTRIDAIDALRGIALCLMFAYHFAFDLRYFGVVALDFENDGFWLGFRALIVTLFLTLVGVSIVLADQNGTTLRRFLRRLAIVAAGALAVTVASLVLFPGSFIYFGILHCIVVASLLAWPVRHRPRLALAVGAVIVLAGLTYASPRFDSMGLSWIGFATRKPVTEDYVPLVPWSAAVFLGLALGRGLLHDRIPTLRPLAAAPRAIRWLGRHSLLVYLVHQPVLMGVLWLLVRR
ncbi:MAG: heparan-alpha-glucosaminide N-acetyltransferase [Casimicrobiaceae bacterium]